MDPNLTNLLERAHAGDDAAAAALIGHVRQQVYRWALVITRDADDAEDVTQQVSLKLHQRLRDFEGRSRFSTWLYTIVRNAAIQLTRKASRRYETSIESETVSAPLGDDTDVMVAGIENRRAAELVRSYFTQLPQRQRELIELIDRGDCTTAEAAVIMGIEPETARVHLLRARRALRSKMLEQHPELVP